MKSVLSESMRDTIIGLLIFVVLMAAVPAFNYVTAFFAHDEWYLLDEGSIAYAAVRSAVGEYPHRDFPYYYAGGFELLLGKVFQQFGSNIAVARMVLGFSLALTGVLIFLIQRKAHIDWTGALVMTLASLAISYGLNFHIYPAWIGTLFLLAAMFWILRGIDRDHFHAVLIAGICSGLAVSTKQNVGVLGILGMLLFICLVGAGTTNHHIPSESKGGRRTLLLEFRFALILTLPLLILGFLVYVVRTQLSPLNIAMFLILPALLVKETLHVMWKSGRRSMTSCSWFLAFVERNIFAYILGAVIGLIPLFAFYWTNGGMWRFVQESFLLSQAHFANRYSEFKFLENDAMTNPFVFARRLVLFLSPLLVALSGMMIARSKIKKNILGRPTQVLLLASIMLILLYFTLYPIGDRTYILYIVPILIIPFSYLTINMLAGFVLTERNRTIVVTAVLVLVIAGYVANRSLAGDANRLIASEVRKLGEGDNSLFVPMNVYEYVQPLHRYISQRPAIETVLSFDVYNKALAFLTDRKIEMDFMQRHYYREIEPTDFVDVLHTVQRKGPDVLILGKQYFRGWLEEQSLISYVIDHYDLAMENETHLVFQRRGNRQSDNLALSE